MSMRYLPLLFSLASATNLYATHYDGHVYSLSLDQTDDGYDLSLASSLKTCGDMPSWVTLDRESRTLYCSDESGDNTNQLNGNLFSLSAAEDGTLTEKAKTPAPGGGVNSVLYEGDDDAKYLAIAHYGGSALSTFKVPTESTADPLQVLRYNLTRPGAVPQQNAPHPHQVILDPTGSFILSPDLGADIIRVYAINKASGHLSVCPSLEVPYGSGPRHGLFWKSAPGNSTLRHRRSPSQTILYSVSELGGHLSAHVVSYSKDGCLAFKKTQSLTPYPATELPEGASLAGIQSVGSHIYISLRSDKGFKPNDSIATLSRSSNGTVTFEEITSAHGTVPRTFEINKKGDLVAIGNQASSNVVIVSRDVESGRLGEVVASLRVGEEGEVGTAEGLSSIVWDE